MYRARDDDPRLEARACPVCGEKFKPRHVTALSCSPTCAQALATTSRLLRTLGLKKRDKWSAVMLRLSRLAWAREKRR